MTQNSIADNRMVWLDVVRCVAMLMVIGVHCIDPFTFLLRCALFPSTHIGQPSTVRFSALRFPYS